jgi:hypothetical protein
MNVEERAKMLSYQSAVAHQMSKHSGVGPKALDALERSFAIVDDNPLYAAEPISHIWGREVMYQLAHSLRMAQAFLDALKKSTP